MNSIRILLADDHEMVRQGLKALIDAQHDLQVVGEAADSETAFSETVQLKPDVVVMDLAMPGAGGAEATRRIKAAAPDIRVVALTAHEDTGYAQQLLHAGASGYVLKRTAANGLIEAIRSVAAGEVYLDAAVAGRVSRGPQKQGCAPRGIGLSAREDAVMRQLARGYTNKEIAACLELSVKTVETYKTRSMEKLRLESRVELVRYASAHGWLSDP